MSLRPSRRLGLPSRSARNTSRPSVEHRLADDLGGEPGPAGGQQAAEQERAPEDDRRQPQRRVAPELAGNGAEEGGAQSENWKPWAR